MCAEKQMEKSNNLLATVGNCFNREKYEWVQKARFLSFHPLLFLLLHSLNGTENELQRKYDFLNRRGAGYKIGRKQSNMPFNGTFHICI